MGSYPTLHRRPSWQSVFRVGIGVSDEPLISGCSTALAHRSLVEDWVKREGQIFICRDVTIAGILTFIFIQVTCEVAFAVFFRVMKAHTNKKKKSIHIYFMCSLPRKCVLRLFVMAQKALMPAR